MTMGQFSFFLLILLLLTCPITNADIFDTLGVTTPMNEGNFIQALPKQNKPYQQLPDLPQTDKLIRFAGVPAYSQYRYEIDEDALGIDKQGIIRFSIQISSPSGAANIYYQGLNCNDKTITTYAYASSASAHFNAYQHPAWQPLKSTGAMGYSQSLFDDYFCDSLGRPLSLSEIINNLKYPDANKDEQPY